jgi:hypothetical protein
MLDILLGAVLGFIAGVAFRAAYLRAFNFGWKLLGPPRAAELTALAANQETTRTAARAVLATVVACAVSGAVILGPMLPARPLVDAWTKFSRVWIIAFMAGAVVTWIVGGRRAV